MKKKNFLNIARKNCSAETRGRWDIFIYFWLRRLFILERCAGVGQYLGEHPLTLFAHSLSNRSLMLSHVCVLGDCGTAQRTHTHAEIPTHTHGPLRGTLFFGLSFPHPPHPPRQPSLRG